MSIAEEGRAGTEVCCIAPTAVPSDSSSTFIEVEALPNIEDLLETS